MCSLFNTPTGVPVLESRVRRVRTLEARVLLDRLLDLDRDPPLHRQREQLAVVGGEGRRRPRRTRALDVDAVVPRLRQPARLSLTLSLILSLSLSLSHNSRTR